MDKEYWEEYYLMHGRDSEIKLHSSFAEFCMKKYFNGSEYNIVELGCGNGRDAIYFAHHSHKVVAIDQCTSAIEIESENIHDDVRYSLIPIAADFVSYDYGRHDSIDVFYSRFTLHAINGVDEDVLLAKVFRYLKNGGIFCVEVRTMKDPLYGKGVYCGDNAYRTDHYRRFVDADIFLKKVLSLGFKLLYFTEENNLSIYGSDNPVLMRIIVKKD